MAATWKWYVYQFFDGERCVYVGKGSERRFNSQQNRFKEFRGHITSYFFSEIDALNHERNLIQEICPQLNKALMPESPLPWKVKLIPEDRDFMSWCEILGTKEMSARLLLSKPWSVLEKYGVDIKGVLSKVGSYTGSYHGARC